MKNIKNGARATILVSAAAIAVLFQNCSSNGSSVSTNAALSVQYDAYMLSSVIPGPFPGGAATHAYVDVVDVNTMQRSTTYDLGAIAVSTIAVNKAHSQIFANGGANGDLVVHYMDTASQLEYTGLTNVRVVRLSPDGSTLYVLSNEGFSSVNPVSFATISVARTSTNDQLMDMTISPDGQSAATLVYDGTAHVELYELANMTRLGRVDVTTGVPGCLALPNRVAFGPANRILASDNNCDSLHQFTQTPFAEIPGDEIQLGRDSASSGSPVLLYDPKLGLAVQTKESIDAQNDGGIAVINPSTKTFTLTGALGGANYTTATAAALTGEVALAAENGFGSSSATVVKYDLNSSATTPTVYTSLVPGYMIFQILIVPR